MRENFPGFKAHVFVAACGIVVRLIAPLIKDKQSDPAVVVLDQTGRFAVSLLSGHLGGANDLAREIAALCGATAVITTATDAAGAPAVEVLARELGLGLDNPQAVKRVNAALAAGQRVQVFDPFDAFKPASGQENFFEWVLGPGEIESERPAVLLSYKEITALDTQVLLRPRVLALGLGCRRGAELSEVLKAIEEILRRYNLSPKSLGVLASIEAKRDEPGLLDAANQLGLETRFFAAEELAGIKTPNPSRLVIKHMGVASVCEASAILAAGRGRLIAPKLILGRVTAAIALAC